MIDDGHFDGHSDDGRSDGDTGTGCFRGDSPQCCIPVAIRNKLAAVVFTIANGSCCWYW